MKEIRILRTPLANGKEVIHQFDDIKVKSEQKEDSVEIKISQVVKTSVINRRR